MGTPHNHACAMRRTLEFAPTTQVGIRSLSPEEAAASPTLRDDDLLRLQHAATIRDWMDRVVDSLTDTVYITIDVDGLDPAIMPATGTPEPGGLSWYEALALLRKVIDAANRRRLRHRGALADPRQRRAELPLREADLQDPVVPVRRGRSRKRLAALSLLQVLELLARIAAEGRFAGIPRRAA